MTPEKIDAIRCIKVISSGHMNDWAEKRDSKNPARAKDRNPCSPNEIIPRDLGAARLARSLAAKPNIPKTASIDKIEKLSAPGWIMIKTPTKPVKIATQRDKDTFSLRKMLAPATTTIGVVWRIIVVVESGVNVRAKE